MSYTKNITEFRRLGNVMSQLKDIENHKASGEYKDLLCTKLSCVSQRDRPYDQYEPEPEQYLKYYDDLKCNNENFVEPGYPDSPLSGKEINAAIVKKTNLGCPRDETGIGSRSSTSAADTSAADTSAADTSIIPEKEGPIPVKEDPPISKRLEELDKKLKQLNELLEQLNYTAYEATEDDPDEITLDEKITAIKQHAIGLRSTYDDFINIFSGNIDEAFKFVTMSGGGYKVKKRRSRKRRSVKRRSRKRRSRKRRSRKRRSVKRSNQHKKK